MNRDLKAEEKNDINFFLPDARVRQLKSAFGRLCFLIYRQKSSLSVCNNL